MFPLPPIPWIRFHENHSPKSSFMVRGFSFLKFVAQDFLNTLVNQTYSLLSSIRIAFRSRPTATLAVVPLPPNGSKDCSTHRATGENHRTNEFWREYGQWRLWTAWLEQLHTERFVSRFTIHWTSTSHEISIVARILCSLVVLWIEFSVPCSNRPIPWLPHGQSDTSWFVEGRHIRGLSHIYRFILCIGFGLPHNILTNPPPSSWGAYRQPMWNKHQVFWLDTVSFFLSYFWLAFFQPPCCNLPPEPRPIVTRISDVQIQKVPSGLSTRLTSRKTVHHLIKIFLEGLLKSDLFVVPVIVPSMAEM